MKQKQRITFPDHLLASITIRVIKLYQHTISPDHSDLGKAHPHTGCKFYPSCSQYARMSLEQKGFFRSILKIIWRILRCNPWSEGGVDFPEKNNRVSKQ